MVWTLPSDLSDTSGEVEDLPICSNEDDELDEELKYSVVIDFVKHKITKLGV